MAAISLGTAMAIGGLASAAGGATKAVIQSKAAKKAAKQQVQGTQEANRYMQQGLGQLSQLYSPYVNQGAGAMNTLGRLTTPGPGARYASPGPPNAMPPVPMGGYGGPPQMAGQRVAGPYPMAAGGDMMVNKPTLFLAGEAGPERATFRPQGGPMAGGGPMMGNAGRGFMDAAAGMANAFGRPRGGPGELSQALLKKSYSNRLPGAMFGPMQAGGNAMGGYQFGGGGRGGPPMGGPPMPAMQGGFSPGEQERMRQMAGGPPMGPFAQMAPRPMAPSGPMPDQAMGGPMGYLGPR